MEASSASRPKQRSLSALRSPVTFFSFWEAPCLFALSRSRSWSLSSGRFCASRCVGGAFSGTTRGEEVAEFWRSSADNCSEERVDASSSGLPLPLSLVSRGEEGGPSPWRFCCRLEMK